MGAGYETIMLVDRPENDLAELVKQSIELLQKINPRCQVLTSSGDVTRIRVPINLRSWGEYITIEIEDKSIRITSECSFDLQILDSGKNRKNVQLIRRCLKMAKCGL